MQKILDMSNMYSGSDIKVLCKEAAMGPVMEYWLYYVDPWDWWFDECGKLQDSTYSVKGFYWGVQSGRDEEIVWE